MNRSDMNVVSAQILTAGLLNAGVRSAARRLLHIRELPMNDSQKVFFDDNDIDAVVIYASLLEGGRYRDPRAMWGLDLGKEAFTGFHSTAVPSHDVATIKTVKLSAPVETEAEEINGRLARMEDARLQKLLDFAAQEQDHIISGDVGAEIFSDWSKRIRRYGGGLLDIEECPVSLLISAAACQNVREVAASSLANGDVSEVLVSDGVSEDSMYLTVGGGSLGELQIKQNITCLPVIGTSQEDEMEVVVYEEIGMCLLRPVSVFKFEVRDRNKRCYSL